MARRIIVSAACLLAVFSAGAWAARPFSTDDAGTVEKGKFELEAGYEYSDVLSGGVSGLCCPGFKHGVTEKMDIGIGFAYAFVPQAAEGLSPACLSLKFAVIQDLLAVSFAQEFGTAGFSLNSAWTRAFGPVEIDVNLGYSATAESDTPGSVTYGAAFIYGFEKFDAGCEFCGDKNGFRDWLAGARYRILDTLAADLGYGGNFAGSAVKVTAGLHYEF
jgi:hypothetical protein